MSAGVSLGTLGSVLGIAAGANALTGGAITNALGMGPSQSAGAAGQQASMLSDPFQGSRGMYGQQLNSLMQGGPQAMQQLQSTPGYQFQMQQGLGAIQSNAGATGQLGSGTTDRNLINYSSGLASQQYGNYFNQLAQLSGANWNSGPNAGSAIQQGQATGNSQTMGGLSTLTSGLGGLSTQMPNIQWGTGLGLGDNSGGLTGSASVTGSQLASWGQ